MCSFKKFHLCHQKLQYNQIRAQTDFPKEKKYELCATETPSQQWEEEFQQLIQKIKTNNISNKTQAQVFTIPVIIHVIHGGEAVGTYPNLAQGQLNSQIQVLNNDFGGIGFNSGNYPANAFVNYASNQVLPQTNLDILGRVMIANCNVQFCLATLDTLGNLYIADKGNHLIRKLVLATNTVSTVAVSGAGTFAN